MMEHNDLIAANDFCLHQQVSYTFIAALEEAGLIEIITIEEQHFLHTDQLNQVEKLSRMYTDLGINQEGVEAIAHLLNRMHTLQQQVRALKQQLAYYQRES